MRTAVDTNLDVRSIATFDEGFPSLLSKGSATPGSALRTGIGLFLSCRIEILSGGRLKVGRCQSFGALHGAVGARRIRLRPAKSSYRGQPEQNEGQRILAVGGHGRPQLSAAIRSLSPAAMRAANSAAAGVAVHVPHDKAGGTH